MRLTTTARRADRVRGQLAELRAEWARRADPVCCPICREPGRLLRVKPTGARYECRGCAARFTLRQPVRPEAVAAGAP